MMGRHRFRRTLDALGGVGYFGFGVDGGKCQLAKQVIPWSWSYDENLNQHRQVVIQRCRRVGDADRLDLLLPCLGQKRTHVSCQILVLIQIGDDRAGVALAYSIQRLGVVGNLVDLVTTSLQLVS